MIALVVAVAFAVVVVIAAWSRRAVSRAERRSVRTYGKALGVLADVSRRSDTQAGVHFPEGDEVGRAHVETEEAPEAPRPSPRARARVEVPPPRVRLTPPSLPGHPSPAEAPEEDAPTQVLRSVPAPRRASERVVEVSSNDQAKLVARQRELNARGPAPSEVDQPAAPIPVVPRPLANGAPLANSTGAPDDAATTAVEIARTSSLGASARAGAVADAPVLPGDATVAQEAIDVDLVLPLTGASDLAGEGGAPPDAPARPMLFDDALEPEQPQGRPPRELRHLAGRENTMRRAATGAAAAVVVGALAVGGYEIAVSRAGTTPATTPSTTGSTPRGSTAPPSKSSSSSSSPGAGSHPTSTSSTTSGPSVLEPTSRSGSVVTYSVPSSSYTLTLSASSAGACWVGVQQSSSGPYLWMDTLSPGATTTYKATGPIFVRIGNPKVLSVAVNGQSVGLPSGRTLVYDVALTPANSAA